MASSENRLSFGQYLLQCRRHRGVGAEDLAAELKISTHLLTAIEKEDFSRLPDPVYTRGFLRVYADTVGADREWVLQDYLKTRSAINAIQDTEASYQKENEHFWRRVGGAVAVMLVVMTMTVLMSGNWQNRLFSPAEEHPQTEALSEDSINENTEGSTSLEEVGEDNIRLSIRAVEETWIKIIIDNHTTREYTLQPGDRLELEASDGYNLLIGNATGVKLTANRIPIYVPGKRGEVVNLEIP